MNGNFFVPVINNFESNESNIKNILMTLDKLKNVTDKFFYSINKNLNEKTERFNNLKLRIIRINKIISILNSRNEALVIKSPKKFPQLNQINNITKKSIFYKELTNQEMNNLYKSSYKISYNNIEEKKKQKSFLFKKFYTSNSLNLKQYKDITLNYDNNELNNQLFEKEKFDGLKNINSCFSFDNLHHINNSEIDEEKILNKIKELTQKEDIQKRIYSAPKSIREKQRISNIRKNNIYNKLKRNIEINIPQNMTLNNLIDIKINENNKKIDKKDFEQNYINNYSDEDDSSQYNEDKNNENETFIPIDLIEQKNINNILKNQANSDIIEINNKNDNNNLEMDIKSNINNIENTNNIINNNITNEKIEINSVKNNENIINNDNNLNNIQEINTNNKDNIIENNKEEINTNNKDNILENNKEEINTNNKDKIIENNKEEINIKLNKEEKKEEPEKKVLTLYEEIGDNPIAKLKKVGSVKVKQIDPQSIKIKNTQLNLMQQLKEQIHLRYINLKKYESENDDDEDEEDED